MTHPTEAIDDYQGVGIINIEPDASLFDAVEMLCTNKVGVSTYWQTNCLYRVIIFTTGTSTARNQ